MKNWRNGSFGSSSEDYGGCHEGRRDGHFNYHSSRVNDEGADDDRELHGAQKLRTPSRPRLSNKTMLRGLVERTECYNKTVDRKVLTDSRVAFDEKELTGGKRLDVAAKELEQLAVINQHIPTRGRGDSFGRMRSANKEVNFSTRSPASLNDNNNDSKSSTNSQIERINVLHESSPPETEIPFEEIDPLTFQSPRRLASRLARATDPDAPRHHFDPSTAYSGRVVPNYRYNYKPEKGAALPVYPVPVASIRPGQRYPKRPESYTTTSSQPKPLSHNYYNIILYGKTQEERTAQRIEKTVRQTEAPPTRF